MVTEHDDIERTEAPSPRLVARARDAGQLPFSREVVLAVTVLAAVLVLRVAGGALGHGMMEMLAGGISAVDATVGSVDTVWTWRRYTLAGLAWLAPLLLVPPIVAIASHVLQVGPRFQPERLLPTAERFDVFGRLASVVSGADAIRSAIGAAKWFGLIALAAWIVCAELAELAGLSELAPHQVATHSASVLLGVLTKMAVAMAVLAAIDYLRAWFAWRSEMRMTRAELAAELRENEGNPHVRRRRRERQVRRSTGPTSARRPLVIDGMRRRTSLDRFGTDNYNPAPFSTEQTGSET
jgi:flagellar biosynthesis protein FlhB